MNKKYITRQEDVKDCGGACISSIVKYFDGYIPMEIIKQDTLTNKEGTTAFHMVKALRKYGFDVDGYKIENILDEKIVLPAIAHLILPNNFHHFVVIYKIDKKHKTILLMDPAKGYKTLSIKEFLNLWSKVIIIMKPKHKIARYQKPKSLVNLFLNLFVENKKLLLVILLISIFFIILSLLSSFYIKLVLNNLNSHFLKIIILFFLITILKSGFEYIRNNYQNKLNTDTDEKVISSFLNHLFFLPLEYVKNKTTGEIITRIRELNNIKNLFSKIFINSFLDFFLTISAMFLIYKINSKVFLILCLIILIYFILSLVFGSKLRKNMESLIDDETNFNSYLVENIDGLETIKNNNQVNTCLKKTNDKFLKYLNNNYLFNKILNRQEFLKNILSEIGVFIIITSSLYYIYLGKMNTLDLITLNALLAYALEPLKSIISLVPEFYYLKTSFNKINEFLTISKENLDDGLKEFKNGDIRIKNMSYSYNCYNYILKDFDLIIKEGEKIMLKGASGSGKSTICKLIYGYYKPNKGSIQISNKSLANYSINTIRNNISYLSQKEKIFNDTIKNNIIFNRKVQEEWYEKILQVCRVNEILKSKPFGDNTMIEDNGFNLSGGEIQRIVLARTLLQNGNILILDEALSEVESYQEDLIIKDILNLFKNKTIIYVTHRDKEKMFDRSILIKQSNKMLIEGESL